ARGRAAPPAPPLDVVPHPRGVRRRVRAGVLGRGCAAMNTIHERVNGHQAAAPPLKPIPQAAVDPKPQTDGETKRVRALRAEVAEAHLLAHLQEDATPLALDTGKVR